MNELLLASPIVGLSILAIIALVLDARDDKNTNLGFGFALGSFVLTLLLSICGWMGGFDSSTFVADESLSKGALNFEASAYFYDMLFLISAIFSLCAARPYLQRENVESTEFYNLVMFSVAGMMIIAHSASMLTLFVGIEIMSLSFYILAGYFRFNKKSIEASLKYFLLGAFATGFLVYGMAMIYGATGSFYFDEIHLAISSGEVHSFTYLKIGLGLMIVGLAFKAATFPFHQWAPDVYTGSPTPVTTFMSTAGKASAIIAFIIVTAALMPSTTGIELVDLNTSTAQMVIALISALTMIIGNITALVQKDVKRMLAYSSVAHAGYLLMGIVANSASGTRGMTFYITAYLFMQIGSFVIVSIFERNKGENLKFSDYSGLYKKHPLMSALMAIFMLSLAGLPPMAGFFGKLLLFTAAIKSGFTWLTIVAVISSVISMYFYIRLVLNMYFKEPPEDSAMENTGGLASLPVYISAIVILLLGILPFLLDDVILKF